jgi:FKBP-type peptidyl-prolyl cis-trans isomerase SlyD
MEKIQPGKYVEMVYDLYVVNPDGEQLVHQVDVENPEKIIFGVTPGVIVPLEKALDGLQTGDTFEVTVPANEGFGQYDEENIAHLEKFIFEIDGKFDAEHIKPGAVVPMMTQDGYQISGRVVEVTPDEVVMDFNHPLAGKEVKFKGKVGIVRDATPEELKPASGCCGCGGHSDESGCNCGDGCNCN